MIAKLKGHRDGNNVIIHKDSFELILLALTSQQVIGQSPPNGDAMEMGKKAYDKMHKDMQKDINDIYRQAMDILHSKDKNSFLHNFFA